MSSASEYDLEEDAARYVVEALAAVRAQDKTRTVDIDDLASNWVLPRPSNYIELRAQYAEEVDEKRSEVGEDLVKEWLIERAIGDINANNDGYVDGAPILTADVIEDADGKGNYRLADGVDIHALKLRGEPLLRKSLPNLFGPEGLWRENIRAIDFDPDKDKDDRELLDLMRENGWPKRHAAEVDEHGVWLTGHRRKAAADILGIPYVTHVDTYGDDAAGEAKRAQVALDTNLGVKKFTPADRAKIARDLYTSDTIKWTTTGIAKLLNVSAMTISRDLSGFNNVKPPPERGGRPRKGDKGSQPAPTPSAPPTPPTLTPVPDLPSEPVTTPDGMTDLGWADETPVEQQPADLDTRRVQTGVWLEWLGEIAFNLSQWADHLESSEAEYREQAMQEYGDALRSVEKQFGRVAVALDMYAEDGGDEGEQVVPVSADANVDDGAVEKVAQRIVKWLTENGTSMPNTISQKALYGPNAKKGLLGNRRFFDAALEQLVGAGSVVVAADGQIELGQEAAK